MEFPDRISYSSWQAYRSGCKWKWKLDAIERKGGKNFGIHMDFGTSVHLAIESYKRRKNPVVLDEAKKIFQDTFSKLYEENNKLYREKEKDLRPEDFVKVGLVIMDHLHKCDELWSAEVVYNEHKLFLPIERSDDVKIMFKGYIDMVVKTKDKRGKTILYVLDFKTCSWGWDGDKRQDKDMHAQLFLYKHFLCKEYDLEPSQVRTAFVLLKKRPAKGTNAVEFFPVSAGPISVQRALDSLNSDITDIDQRVKANDFPKDRKQCTNSFGDICPYLNTEFCPGTGVEDV